MKREWMSVVATCAMLGGCGGGSHVESAASEAASADDWRTIATTADRGRLRGWRGAWVDGLAQVKPNMLVGDAALFDPDRSLADPTLPPGAYRCRTFKIGARDKQGPAIASYGWYRCRVDLIGGKRTLTKLDGAQRPMGTIYTDTDSRSVFLGTMELGDERSPMNYGRDASRNMAGVVERIGSQRWRLVLPYPSFESVLDVVELIPA